MNNSISTSSNPTPVSTLPRLGPNPPTMPAVDIGGGAAYLEFAPQSAYTPLASPNGALVQASDTEIKVETEAPDCTEDGRPIIRVMPGQVQQTARDAEHYLAQTGRHFQRGGAIVTVRTDPASGESTVQDLQALALMHALDGVSAWTQFDQRKGTWVQIDPPVKICNLMIKAAQLESLPVLNGLVRQPYLRPDGSVCLTAGHDLVTGLFGVFDPAAFDVPSEPTRRQAEAALARLDDLVSEFAFAAPHDRSAALAAMLTAVVRPSLPHAPLFHVRAPQIASGKSYLCEIFAALATPQRATPVSFPGGDEECSKLLLAQLLRSPAVIDFDNLTGDLKPYKSLCTALTSERMEGRTLGHTRMVKVGTRTLFLSSGKNVGPVADMSRRCVTILLDPGCETPAARTFTRPNLVADLRCERGRYVSAVLTVVRAWIVAGRPAAPCRPLATFGDWSDLCRQPLLWLGQPDPATAVFEGMAEDPDRELLGRLLTGWSEQFGDTALMVRDVVARTASGSAGTEAFADVLLDITGDSERINRRKLGRWLTRNAGRIVDGLRLVKARKTRNAENWRVESVWSVSSVESVPAISSTKTGGVVAGKEAA